MRRFFGLVVVGVILVLILGIGHPASALSYSTATYIMGPITDGLGTLFSKQACVYDFSLKEEDSKGQTHIGSGVKSTTWYVAYTVASSYTPVVFNNPFTQIPLFSLTYPASASKEYGGNICPTSVKAVVELESGGSCSSCGGKSSSSCWCDDECKKYGNCCSNRDEVCNGPTTEKKKPTCEVTSCYFDKDGDGYGLFEPFIKNKLEY